MLVHTLTVLWTSQTHRQAHETITKLPEQMTLQWHSEKESQLEQQKSDQKCGFLTSAFPSKGGHADKYLTSIILPVSFHDFFHFPIRIWIYKNIYKSVYLRRKFSHTWCALNCDGCICVFQCLFFNSLQPPRCWSLGTVFLQGGTKATCISLPALLKMRILCRVYIYDILYVAQILLKTFVRVRVCRANMYLTLTLWAFLGTN